LKILNNFSNGERLGSLNVLNLNADFFKILY